MNNKLIFFFTLFLSLFTLSIQAEDGSKLWLRNDQQQEAQVKDKSKTAGGAIGAEE